MFQKAFAIILLVSKFLPKALEYVKYAEVMFTHDKNSEKRKWVLDQLKKDINSPISFLPEETFDAILVFVVEFAVDLVKKR
ncbi:MAG: hypothetical protein QXT97_02495 [Candidatus Diapherotrites archaeon]